MRRLLPALACLCLASTPLLAGCGNEPPPPAAEATSGGWMHARLQGVASPSGVAVLGSTIAIVGAGGDRRVHVLDRAALVAGTSLGVRDLELEVDRDAYLAGAERFATRGYQLGDLWDDDVDFQGIALLPPGRIFLAERRYRVAWAGEIERDDQGVWQRVHLQRAFILPGARRGPTWLDEGPGIAGLATAGQWGLADDLFAVERVGIAPRTFRIAVVDRVAGGPQGGLGVVLDEGDPADVAGLVREEDRYVVLCGGGGATLAEVDSKAPGLAHARAASPVPAVEGAGPWAGLGEDEEGTLYVVSGAPGPVLAWREGGLSSGGAPGG